MKRSALVRRTALTRGAPLRRTAWRRSAPRPAVPVEVRAALTERSGGVCEIGIRWKAVCAGRAVDPSHRIAVGMGGSSGPARKRADRLSNVMHACRPCHDWITREPLRAQMNGWVLERWQDPTQEPVWYRGRLVYLTDGGMIVDFESACA